MATADRPSLLLYFPCATVTPLMMTATVKTMDTQRWVWRIVLLQFNWTSSATANSISYCDHQNYRYASKFPQACGCRSTQEEWKRSFSEGLGLKSKRRTVVRWHENCNALDIRLRSVSVTALLRHLPLFTHGIGVKCPSSRTGATDSESVHYVAMWGEPCEAFFASHWFLNWGLSDPSSVVTLLLIFTVRLLLLSIPNSNRISGKVSRGVVFGHE